MNRFRSANFLLTLTFANLLAGCSSGSSPSSAADATSDVTVTTVMPARKTFHDNVEALGSTVGDPHRARMISVAFGGQIVGLNVAAGQPVTRGQTLLEISADPGTRSAYRQAETAMNLARGDLARTRKLAAQRLATTSQVATARKALADAQTTMQAQRAIGGGTGKRAVKAPADGVVTALHVGLGDRVAANSPLLGFTPAQALVAQLGVPLEDRQRLRPGVAVQLQSVYGPKRAFAGTLRMIGQSVDSKTHLLPAQVELPAKASSVLVAGAAVTARIHVCDYTAWAVPRQAVLNDQHGDYLFQIERGHAKRIDVTVRKPDGDTIGVAGSLDAKAPVIVLGVYELNDGDAVTVASHPSGSTARRAQKRSIVPVASPAANRGQPQ